MVGTKIDRLAAKALPEKVFFLLTTPSVYIYHY